MSVRTTTSRRMDLLAGAVLLGLLAISAPAAEVKLLWDAPACNADGSHLTDLAGTHVYYGTARGHYAYAVDVTNGASHCTITGLATDTTYFFAVSAYNDAGVESALSKELMVTIPPPKLHSADYASPHLVIDSKEVGRVLSYWRTGGYQVDAAGPDGFAATHTPATANTHGALHSADYAAPHHVIDASEAARVLAYWRAGGYTPDASGVDGYAPLGLKLLGGGEAPSANAQQSAAAHYDPGQTLAVTSTLHYTGQLLSLRWRPALPSDYAIVAVSGDGDPELFGGDILWIGGLPPNPIQMVYTVRVPLSAVGPQAITSEVTCFLQGQSNPVQAIPAPSLLTVNPADVDGDGLPDSWETHYAGGPAGLDPDADDDGDGASNLEESLAGTAPDDPASVFAMTRLVREPDGRIAIHWKSAAGRRYAVARAPSPGAPFVTQAASITANAPLNVWRDTPADDAACFYRVLLVD